MLLTEVSVKVNFCPASCCKRSLNDGGSDKEISSNFESEYFLRMIGSYVSSPFTVLVLMIASTSLSPAFLISGIGVSSPSNS